MGEVLASEVCVSEAPVVTVGVVESKVPEPAGGALVVERAMDDVLMGRSVTMLGKVVTDIEEVPVLLGVTASDPLSDACATMSVDCVGLRSMSKPTVIPL